MYGILSLSRKEEHFRLFKYADDMVLDCLLDKTTSLHDVAYLDHTKALGTWCHLSQL